MILYHYACGHSAEQIRRSGTLRPWRQLVLGDVELVWLTDLDQPDRDALGLTSHIIRCDRTEFRVTADATDAIRWVRYARALPVEMRRPLELEPGVLPMHWWVSTSAVPVLSVERVGVADRGAA